MAPGIFAVVLGITPVVPLRPKLAVSWLPLGSFCPAGFTQECRCFARLKSEPFRGKYVMVMGVLQACSPEPCLQAVKMTDLSDNPIHESMWELEVEDLHRNIP
ncbi:hypothetical protein PANDA_011676 [Ailuropoda melanoleuca]|uniref:RecQ mediated genome instability 2 n=1 Tax=Ailuropoda melanoleuca TaxID=9646 RepID=D2HK04_AILME|nr:hypothetical protein PANDA_011676 [Ailuropoda melanoleuca]